VLKLIPRRMLRVLILAGLYSLVSACSPQNSDITAQQTPPVVLHQAAVAMPDNFSAEAAKAILEKGGNAVDAAITAQFVLAVTLPEAGNIGGGGFMLIHKDGQNDFIDYREKAPLAAHRDMYLDEQGDVVPDQSIIGILASGVPGTVAGMWLAHQKYGSLPWQDLVQPAVVLAEQGFVVHPKLGGYIERHIKRLAERGFDVNFKDFFATAVAGEVFKQTELAKTLSRIRDEGRDGFYLGETAKLIADFMRKEKGLISEQDLAQCDAVAREPLTAPQCH
jgi:gamma-glutamyltranspeptidase/glutathione hydrolase